MKAKHCDFCQHHDYARIKKQERLICKKGHKPRFYMPKDDFDAQWGDDWGWKRRCNDFEIGDHVQRIPAS